MPPIQLSDVVQQIQNERVLLCEARVGYRLACLVMNRCGLDKCEVAETAEALASLEQLIHALVCNQVADLTRYAVELAVKKQRLAKCETALFREATEKFFAFEAFRHAFAEFVEDRLAIRRAAAPAGERVNWQPNFDDITALREVAKELSGQLSPMVAMWLIELFNPVMSLLELAAKLAAYEADVAFERVAPKRTQQLGDETNRPASETPAVNEQTPREALLRTLAARAPTFTQRYTLGDLAVG